MERCNAPVYHYPGKCNCIVNAACLREVRDRHMLSFEAIAAKSDFSREYLARVERGDEGKCGDANVIRAYSEAMGTSMEAAVLVLLHDITHSTLSCLEMFARLYYARHDQVL